MPINRRAFTVTTNAWGGGTATGIIRGDIVHIRMPLGGTAITAQGGTTDFLFTDADTGGTILTAANQIAPWEYTPAKQLFTTSAGSVIYAAGTPVYEAGVPSYGTVTMTVVDGQYAKSGTVYVFSRI